MQAATASYSRDVYAASSKGPRWAKLKTAERVVKAAGYKRYPATPDSIACLAAALKRARFRSAMGYVSAWTTESRRKGHPWTAAHDVAVADAKRSTTRGIGPPQRAKPVPVEALCRVQCRTARSVVLVACWWCLRSAEAARLKPSDIVIDKLAKTATITIRSSKTDQQGVGKAVSHGCTCGVPAGTNGIDPRYLCPYHAAKEMLAQASGDGRRYLLSEGRTRPPQGALARWVRAAMRVADPGTPPAEYTGHSCRRGGAQFLRQNQASLSDILCAGRWTSGAVMAYLTEATQECGSSAVAAKMVAHAAADDTQHLR